MKYFAALLLLGLAAAATLPVKKSFTVYGASPANQYYNQYAAPAYYWPAQGGQAYYAPQARPSNQPLQIRDVYYKPVLVLLNDTKGARDELKACVLPEGLSSMPRDPCTRATYQQLLRDPEDQHALLFDSYSADIERFYRFRNFTVNRFELPNNTKVSYLAHTLANGLPSLLICEDEYCADGIRKAFVKKIAEVGVTESSVEVLKDYQPANLYSANFGPGYAYPHPATAFYPYSSPGQQFYPYPAASYPQANAYSYYPQAHPIPAGYGIFYPQGYAGQGSPIQGYYGPTQYVTAQGSPWAQ